jgi:hypothetical protein
MEMHKAYIDTLEPKEFAAYLMNEPNLSKIGQLHFERKMEQPKFREQLAMALHEERKCKQEQIDKQLLHCGKELFRKFRAGTISMD